MILSPRRRMPAGVETCGHPSHLRRMQSPTDPADQDRHHRRRGPSRPPTGPASRLRTTRRTPSSASWSRTAGRSWRTGPTDADRPRRVAFVDGTLRTEARLTRTDADGDVSMGLAGSWAAGAVLVDGDEPARFDRVTTGRAAIFTSGRPFRLPDHRDGWRWEQYAVDGSDVEAARQQLQRLMRDAEADIAEALSNEGWLTVLDGPLHGIRHRRGLPVIGYVKTHHRRMLTREHWVRVPELTAGERSGLFAMGDALYGCYLRVGDPGPWAGPWAGIARLEMPSGIGWLAAGLRVGHGCVSLAELQPEATHVIVLETTNDIGMAFDDTWPSVDDLIAGHRTLIQRAHARELTIYGGTLLPFEGAFYWTEAGEAKRQALNTWIRTSGAYDGVINFDAAVRDPDQLTRFRWDLHSGNCSASTTFAARVASFEDVTRHPQNDRTRFLVRIAIRRHESREPAPRRFTWTGSTPRAAACFRSRIRRSVTS